MHLLDQIKCTRSSRSCNRADTSTSAHHQPPASLAQLRTDAAGWAYRLAAALLCTAAPHLANAQIYVSEADIESGAILLSNFSSSRAQLLVADSIDSMTNSVDQAASADQIDTSPPQVGKSTQTVDLRQLIAQVALEFRVGADLIAAVAAAESRFNPTARSLKGALGLMQLMPATALRFGVHDVWAVEDNLRGGAAYLRWLLDLFGGDISLAVAAYNSGEHAVLKAGRRIPAFGETRRYVPLVLAWREHYAAEFGLTETTQNHPLTSTSASNRRARLATVLPQVPTAVLSSKSLALVDK